MKAPTVFEQTGWKRPYPQMICQELAVLRKVTQWDFDLGNVEFCRYAESRGVLHLAGVGKRRAFTQDFTKGFADYLNDRDWWWCEPYRKSPSGPLVRDEMTRETVEAHFQLVLMARARLQDCWELFKAQQVPQGLPAGSV